jgi:hypothetical protein
MLKQRHIDVALLPVHHGTPLQIVQNLFALFQAAESSPMLTSSEAPV